MRARVPFPAAYRDGSEDPAIDGLFDPVEHWSGPNVTFLADQIHNGPVSLPELHVLHCQGMN